MNPEILIYEDGQITITLNAVLIPEIKNIIEKYPEDDAIPYLAYVHLMTALNSPFANEPEEEKSESITFDIHQQFTNFDPTEPLLEPAVDKLKGLNEGPVVALAKELQQELHRFRKLIKDTPLTLGDDGNFRDRLALMEKMEKIATSYNKVKLQAEAELKTKMRGKAQLGDY